MQKVTYTNSRGDSIELFESPFFLKRITGLGNVEAEVQTQKSPGQHGSTYIDSTLEERYLDIEIHVLKDLQYNRRLLSQVFNPILGEGLLVYENDSIKVEINAIPEHVPTFDDVRPRRTEDVTISLRCPNPFWRSPNIIEAPMASFTALFEFPLVDGFEVGAEGSMRVISNDGVGPTPILITFNGPAVNPEVRNNTTGKTIKVNRTLEVGDVLTINTEFGNKFVRINGENAFNWIDIESEFWDLQVGDNEIEYRADAGQDEATLTIEWYNRFLGV